MDQPLLDDGDSVSEVRSVPPDAATAEEIKLLSAAENDNQLVTEIREASPTDLKPETVRQIARLIGERGIDNYMKAWRMARAAGLKHAHPEVYPDVDAEFRKSAMADLREGKIRDLHWLAAATNVKLFDESLFRGEKWNEAAVSCVKSMLKRIDAAEVRSRRLQSEVAGYLSIVVRLLTGKLDDYEYESRIEKELQYLEAVADKARMDIDALDESTPFLKIALANDPTIRERIGVLSEKSTAWQSRFTNKAKNMTFPDELNDA